MMSHVHRHFHIKPLLVAMSSIAAAFMSVFGCQGPTGYQDDASVLHPVTAGERAAASAARTAQTVGALAASAAAVPQAAAAAMVVEGAASGYAKSVAGDVTVTRAEFDRMLNQGLQKHDAAMSVALGDDERAAEQKRWEQWRKETLNAENQRMYLAALTAGIGSIAAFFVKRKTDAAAKPPSNPAAAA